MRREVLGYLLGPAGEAVARCLTPPASVPAGTPYTAERIVIEAVKRLGVVV